MLTHVKGQKVKKPHPIKDTAKSVIKQLVYCTKKESGVCCKIGIWHYKSNEFSFNKKS